MKREKLIRNLATFLSLLTIFGFLKWANSYTSPYIIQILNITAIYIILSTSYNLVNGVTVQFSLGPNAIMAVGGLTLGLIEILFVAVLPSYAGYRDAIAFFILIFILLFKPTGIVGEKLPD